VYKGLVLVCIKIFNDKINFPMELSELIGKALKEVDYARNNNE